MSTDKQITPEELAEHNNKTSCWIVVGNRVIDVTKFLAEHPGGEEVIAEQAGKDATEAFEDVGHSADARGMLDKYVVGTYVASSGQAPKRAAAPTQQPIRAGVQQQGINPMFYLAPLIIVGAVLYSFYGN